MRKNKFITQLLSLNAKEIKEFVLFVSSPFFNKNKSLISLLTYLIKFFPSFNQKKFTKEHLLKELFGNQKSGEQKLKNQLSELSKLFEKYLIQIKFQDQKLFNEHLLLNSFLERNLGKMFVQKSKKIEDLIEDLAKEIDPDYYYCRYLIQKDKFLYYVTRKQKDNNSNLASVLQNLDAYYLIDKLRFCCGALVRQNLVNEKIELQLLDELVDYIETQSFQETPLIILWYKLLLLLKDDEDEALYYDMLENLYKYDEGISKDELRQICTGVFNYCNNKLKQGKTSYLANIFNIYKYMLSRNILLAGAYIPFRHYRNIVVTASRLNEIEWAENFIYEYKDKLEPDQKENITNYCLGELAFAKQNYNETLDYLLKFEFEDFDQYIQHKVLLTKTYYELDEYESLSALMHSFRTYLSRSESLTPFLQKSYKNFITYTNKIYKLKFVKKDEMKNDTLRELDELSQITNKDWLLEKLKEI